jgi:hypothetical protein
MAVLVRATRLSHDETQKLLETSFVGSDGTGVPAIQVTLGKRSPSDVQNNTEMVQNLTLKRLDRLHRFARLWRTLPWTIAELDYVLGRLAGGAPPADIVPVQSPTPGTLERIADLLDLNDSWSLPVDDLLAVTGDLPAVPLRDPTSLFDRLFNPAPFVARDGKWPPQAVVRFTHPSWQRRTGGGGPAAGVSSPPDNTLTRLLAGLQLADQDLVDLVAGLRTVAAIDYQPATAATDESIALNQASISALYRHARLRTLLKRKVPEYLDLLTMSGATRELGSPEEVRTLVAFATWQRGSGFTVDELTYLLGGDPPSGSPDPGELATDIPARVAAEGSLIFADTIFTQVGLTEQQSRDAVRSAANLSATAGDTKPFEALPDGVSFRLKAGGITAVTVPSSVAQAAVASLLGRYDALRVLDVELGGTLGIAPEVVTQLRSLADPLDAGATAAVTRALQGGGAAGDTDRLREAIDGTLRFHTLFKGAVFDLRGVTFARQHPEVFFGGAAPSVGAINPLVLRNVAGYAAWGAATDVGFTTASGPPDLDALETVVTGLGAASDADVAKVLRTDEGRIASLRPQLTSLPANLFDALDVMASCLRLGDQLGASGETFALMIADSTPAAAFAALSRAAEDVFGAFRSKYPIAQTFQEKVEPYDDQLRGRKRDGLLDYIVTRWPVPFSDPSKLYEYFLVDVLVEGCARTSRLVAALSSLQLYVQRVLMNLERSDDWDGTVPPVTGVYARFTDDERRREWPWRQQLRVWEANRKVFLYPENYIEPELRDDKTPLFEELEDTLLVQEIDDANVHDAYSRYLTGFDELARLTVAGAYYDQGEHKLHLFGVTQDDAPLFYYRSITDNPPTQSGTTPPPTFSPWQKLDLQIPVRKVSPIVFEGRLYMFWVETTTRPVNQFVAGKNDFTGYRHTVRIKYSMLRLDGAWSAPQLVRFVEGNGTGDSRIVEDPRDDTLLNDLTSQLDSLQGQLGDCQQKQGQAANDYAKALSDWSAATVDRVQKYNYLQALITVGLDKLNPDPTQLFRDLDKLSDEPKAGLYAAYFSPIPGSFDTLLSILVGIAYGAYADASGTEDRLNEAQLMAKDALTSANQALQKLLDDIAALKAALSSVHVMVKWDASNRDHTNALDNYRPEGWRWDRVYPGLYGPPDGSGPLNIRLMLVPRNLPDEMPSENRAWTSGDFDASSGLLREQSSSEDPAWSSMTRLNWSGGTIYRQGESSLIYGGEEFFASTLWLEHSGGAGIVVGYAPITSEVQIVNGDIQSMIVESQGDSVWLRHTGTIHAGLRLGTSLTRTLASAFWHSGPASLLDASFQRQLEEARSSISPVAGQSDPKRANPFHPENAYLTYYWETFFHIPFLVANHLNAQQDFADTQRWYHYIFDPTAADGEPWRYRPFAQPDPLSTTTLRDILIDEQALTVYREDPFNPHAIARTRTTAYQKTIVMKYIDNLLDWGDSLFSQFTMESLNEATMLYVMAQDILGPRPVVLGSCGGGKEVFTYNTVKAGLNKVSDFLVELEAPPVLQVLATSAGASPPLVIGSAADQPQSASYASTAAIAPQLPGGAPAARTWRSDRATPLASLNAVAEAVAGAGAVVTRAGNQPVMSAAVNAPLDLALPPNVLANGRTGVRGGATISPFGTLQSQPISVKEPPAVKANERFRFDPAALVPSKETVFCIPPNSDLLAYWDRVENRLFNIRNCMDITGLARQPELFAPEIDPRLLVRMKAAGLSLEDVLNSTSGNLPPYRFVYLVDKAKQYAGTVQSFGAQLLSALEKRDAEELSHLRTVHEQNLLKLATRTLELEITAAEDALEGLRRQQTTLEYRRDHFASLRESGQLPEERKQQELQGTASDFRTAAGVAQVVASILTIIPDMGAWTAMKFGGSQLGAAGRAVAEGLNAVAAFNEMRAARAGVEASNQRRDQEWAFQLESARLEISQLEKNIDAATIRRDIAVRALEVHEQSVAQSEELFELLRDKFTNADRYRLLATDLLRLHRLAFNAALATARLTEQAYRVERDEDALLTGGYWDVESAGLLAGERLLVDLHRLEQQFIESNYRELEIEQSFSLAQFAPDALAGLRLTGECSFDVPEWFFDLWYPGQYRRRLKAVRLTIPCVSGPFTNVGATLRLQSSQIRLTLPTNLGQGLGPLTSVPLRHTVSIATSRAQNDAGVFDFNFRDERYMPFEAAGAISSWLVSLPRTLRTFDYSTISDVVLHLSYTAQYDEGLRQVWDGAAQKLLALFNPGDPAAEPPLTRLFSLRSDFPDVFNRLITSPPGTEIDFSIERRHLPLFLGGWEPTISTATLGLVTPLSTLPGTRIAIARQALAPAPQTFKMVDPPAKATTGEDVDALRAFESDITPTAPDDGGLSGAVLGTYIIKLEAAGPLSPTQPASGPVDSRKLRDVTLRLGYRVGAPP